MLFKSTITMIGQIPDNDKSILVQSDILHSPQILAENLPQYRFLKCVHQSCTLGSQIIYILRCKTHRSILVFPGKLINGTMCESKISFTTMAAMCSLNSGPGSERAIGTGRIQFHPVIRPPPQLLSLESQSGERSRAAQ